MKLKTSTENFLYLVFPLLLCTGFSFLFYAVLTFLPKTGITVGRSYYFGTAFLSLSLLALYSEYSRVEKKHKYFLPTTFVFFWLFSMVILLYISSKKVDFNFLALLLFIQLEIVRLMKRLVENSFPLLTIVLNFLILVFMVAGINFTFVPFLYLSLQIAEELLDLKYEKLKDLYGMVSVRFTAMVGLLLLVAFFSPAHFGVILILILLLFSLTILAINYFRTKNLKH
jgi:membrane-associated HD superfamily phosphohydrolase